MAILHYLLLVGVLVLIRHGGAAGPGWAEDVESKNLPGSNPPFTSEPLYRHCDAPSGMPVDSCCRRPGKNGGLTPSLNASVHTHTHTHPEVPAGDSVIDL